MDASRGNDILCHSRTELERKEVFSDNNSQLVTHNYPSRVHSKCSIIVLTNSNFAKFFVQNF